MEIIPIILIIISIDIIITTLICLAFANITLQRFKAEDEFDESVVKSIKIICEKVGLEYKTSTIEPDNRK